LGKNTTVSRLNDFIEEYRTSENSDSSEDSDGADDLTNKHKKPDDWNALFNKNVDDDFKLGIQMNPCQGKGSGADKGAYIRLFTDFYASDIILASPLGLRLVIESGKGYKLILHFVCV
jgi:U3 small nucleolar RNA-associated protein 25